MPVALPGDVDFGVPNDTLLNTKKTRRIRYEWVSPGVLKAGNRAILPSVCNLPTFYFFNVGFLCFDYSYNVLFLSVRAVLYSAMRNIFIGLFMR